MYRLAVSRVAPLVCQRNFVSSVLLTRTYENESVAALKREVKLRGLSPKGNKANLIQVLQEHDKAKTLEEIASRDPPVPAGARAMSTDATSSRNGLAPGIPPAAQPTPAPPQAFLNINIPDVSQPDPEIPIQIPYVPDNWDSSTPVKAPVEEPRPKLVVVAGAETHAGGGPSHKLVDENLPVDNTRASDSNPSEPREAEQGGFWDDVTEDIGIPHPQDIKKGFWKLFS